LKILSFIARTTEDVCEFATWAYRLTICSVRAEDRGDLDGRRTVHCQVRGRRMPQVMKAEVLDTRRS